jgi:CDP-glucose 4,6-dehydratase
VANVLVGRFGRSDLIEVSVGTHQHEAQLLQLNCDKAHQELKWYPRWDVERTLAATADWYQAIMQGEDARTVTSRQIRDYFPEIA